MEPEVIHRFLQSVGQQADVDFYLKLFRAQRKDSFAIIAANGSVVRTALDPLHFDLRILAGLGLTPVVLLGLSDADDAQRRAVRVFTRLMEDEVPARLVEVTAGAPEPAHDEVRATLLAGSIPVVSLPPSKEIDLTQRFLWLRRLVTHLDTRKVVLLSTRSGLARRGALEISAVTLSRDYDRLTQTGVLSQRHTQLLQHVKTLLEQVPHRMTVSVVNPLLLLREFFTMRGAGTLIRKGAHIETHNGFDRIDRKRLQGLLESAFNRPMAQGLLDPGGRIERETDRLYLEENYRGAALVNQTPAGVYLGKFAVERQGQGEGIGSDLWAALVGDYPSFFWRARPQNPIVPWYVRQCEGLVRLDREGWHVFWRGLAPAQIEAAVAHTLQAPVDFPLL
jgi:hypothetical protein